MDEDVFTTDRALFLSIAYRMLGCASEAEDVMQDAWLCCREVDRSAIRSHRAFVMTIVRRLCLDRLKSARMNREANLDRRPLERLLTSTGEGPDAILHRGESVTLAFLVLLEELRPRERAAFLLKEVFEYGHAEIARALDTTTENSRQLLRRAKARLGRRRPRPAASTPADRLAAEQFARRFAGFLDCPGR
jgi:RNA polymerase sigma-70 factor (ECF subfamily)